MNPTYRTSNPNAAGPNASPVGLLPFGTADGDLLLAFVFSTAAASNPSITGVPAGWTASDNTIVTNARMAVYWKIAASEPASWTWTLSASADWFVNVFAVQYPGDTIAPIDASGIQPNAANTAIVAPSVTPTRINGLLINQVYQKSSTGNISVDPLLSTLGRMFGTGQIIIAGGYQTLPQAVASGTRTDTSTVSALNIGWNGIVKAPVWPGPTLRASTNNASSVADTSPIGNRPAGISAGDALYACVWLCATSVPTITSAPSGWTLLDMIVTSGSNARMAIYWKIATGSELPTWSWGLSAASPWIVQVACVQNPGDLVTPTDVSGISANVSNVNVFAPTLSPTLANGLMLGFFGTRAATTFAPDYAMVEAQDAQNSVVPTSTLEMAWQGIDATGNTNGRSATAGIAALNIGWLGIVKGPPVVLASPAGRGDAFLWSL